MRTHRVLFVGNLVNYYTKLCRALNRTGLVEAHVLTAGGGLLDDPDWEYPGISGEEWVHSFRDRCQLLAWFMAHQHAFDIVQLSGSFVSVPRYRKNLVYALLGADLIDLPWMTSIRGRLTRRNLVEAPHLLFTNINHIQHLEALGITTGTFFGHPIDTDYYRPIPDLQVSLNPARDGLYILNGSRLDWGQVGGGPQTRNGNNLLLEAFLQLVREAHNVRLIVPLVGRDVVSAQKFVAANRLGEWVVLTQPKPKRELIRLYNKCHIVSDRFLSGGFGFTTLEAMACGRAVLVNANNDWVAACYGPDRSPPVLNVASAEQIYQAIRGILREPQSIGHIGGLARQWVLREHESMRQATALVGSYKRWGCM
jgi:glycosyltransferase involved in cell wall biosynthesis